MRFLAIFAIIACGYDTFYLTPYFHIRGVFNIADIGNIFLWVYFLIAFMDGRLPKLYSGFGTFILLYLLMIAIHVSIASFFYGQSILDGILAARHQAYYLMYFVFLDALDSEERINKFFSILSYVVAALILVAVLNYAGMKLLYHEKWADGHGERSGITRAFIPAMHLVSMLFVWFLAKYLNENKLYSKAGLGVVFFFAALLFRQTRGRILAALITMSAMMVSERRYKALFASFVLGLICVLGASLFLEENILVNLVGSAFTDVLEEEGTWSGRQATLAASLDAFYEHPIVGSGALVIRNSHLAGQDIYSLAYQGDLGYAHWLKNFGLVGAFWLLSLIILAYQTYRANIRQYPNDWQMRFAFFAFLQIIISMVTLNYLVKVEGIIVFCLLLAVMTRRNQINARGRRLSHAI